MNRKMYKYFFTCVFLIALISCKHQENEYHSLTDKIKAKSEKYQGVSISSESYIGNLKTIEITEGDHIFLIPDRKSQITSYACTECHSKPVEELKGVALKKAHWDVVLEHANQEIMNCNTCHNGNDMDNLQSLTGKTIDFNRSYQLCAQCHSSQFEDWKGGAHGKNIGGWAKPRAAMTCVNCHNPHKPKILSRWPSRFNTQKVKERE
ncbi:cytochrome C [Aquimarina sp. MMG015]|uniref:cytochrome c3 family protein n=1 Tax=unclassified Aquimarina TaxID=2627091 RepID=UPI000E490409|nr:MULTISPECIES: cytochrome c3 family protein [unclassified Aquimarina]AXT55187.1 cytochrome C [Aquimarina sp. AD1]MBQ4802151.1 cytochrome C [Aquimarina sp. MMG015]RKN13012.1 cytochrome C [Aquimarina sp. AD1]